MKRNLNNRPSLMIACCGLVATLAVATSAFGQTVRFTTPNKNIYMVPAAVAGPGERNAFFDVFLEIGGAASVPSTVWGTRISLALESGAGLPQFNPKPYPTIQPGDPNFDPADYIPNMSTTSTGSYTDYDLDFNGGGYSAIGGTTAAPNNSILKALGVYIVPQAPTPAPPTDANGNLTVPTGAGLFRAPLFVPDGTNGVFTVTFSTEVSFDGVAYETGLADPNDIGIHALASGIVGKIRIRDAEPGDTNVDGGVDIADLGNLVNKLGTPGPHPWLNGNFDGSPDVDIADLAQLINNLGHAAEAVPSSPSAPSAVPEPATVALAVMGVPVVWWVSRRRRQG